MKKILTGVFLLVVLLHHALAQIAPKGGDIAANPDTTGRGKTWALVIGISKYKNIQGLNFADRDAQVFYDYLVKTRGGPGLDTSQVRLLLNGAATSVNIFDGLEWLGRNVRTGDRVIFYFSGHGDVEKKTIVQNGFLLATDAPKAAYMTSGTILLKYLQDYMMTYVVQNKAADVLLIADACRSGKLAGGSEGVGLTMRALGQPWHDQIIKILSAQEGELSYEDPKWGGGRGVFSYYLMKGIEGQAARGSDSLITTTDLKLYLDRAVADATGNLQNPNIDGNPHQRLFTYNRDLLALSGRDHASSAGLVASNAKGTAEGLGPDVALLYRHYLGYLGEGRLIWGKDPSDTLNCARHLYWQLIGKEGAESIRASLRSSLISALQRKTQDELDEYVKGKLLKFSSQEALGEILYLRGLIDPSYKLYDYVMARAYFMQSVFAGNKREKIRLLKKTLQLEPDAPYALNQLGYVYNVLQQQDSARYWYQKALAAAPRWAFVYNNIGNVYYDLKDYDRALLDYRQAMRLDSTYANPCEGSGLVYHELKQDDKALLYYARAIRLDSSYAVSYKNIGDLYYDEKKYPLALSNFQRALQLDSMDAVVYNAIGNVKAEQQANQAALGFYRRAVWLDSAYATPYQNIGKIYVDLQLPDSAAVYYRRALNLDSTRTSAYNSLGNIDWDRKDFDGALACFKKAAQLAPDSVDYLLDVSLTYLYKQDETRARLWLKSALKLPVLKAETAYNLACVYSRLQETTTGLKYLALALEKGYNQYDDTQQDEDLANIRKTPGFSILIRQYFPGKVKNK